jgi:hypothetical protein
MSRRVLVRHSSGTIREVAASAVPVMAPGGWQQLTDAELDTYRQEQAAAKDARRSSLTAHSQRPPAASAPSPRPRPRRSGGTARAEGTTEQAVEATEQQKDED